MSMNCWPWVDPDDVPERGRYREGFRMYVLGALSMLLVSVVGVVLAGLWLAGWAS